ncbi:MAG: DUF1343 domain-containing protein [Tannerellaceae bacterium]|jgi:uncharacterized protein YbbC (DUF1343 family)|nr:DUF1343 domain-containing protein [Tannerellaceae bacterium]
MRTIILLLTWIFLTVTAGWSQQNPSLVLGAERMDVVVGMLKGKQVGLVVNQTSILEKTKAHLLDTLLAEGIAVKKVFAPEHGFRGTADAGEEIKDSRDKKTGIPIVSIYGKNHKPTAAQLKGLDVVVFDIQDVGARFYTYISTMHYVMEACAENNIEFIVLDRPNPNDYIDGPIRKKGLESFIGVDPIPVLHGLTVAELAQMINGEGWFKNTTKKCRMQVVPMLNWKHGDPYWLPVKPSPNLPNDQSIRLYPSLCFFEATNVSIGRGTYFPFQMIGYPDEKYGDFTFTPESLPGFDTNPLQKSKKCYGIDLREYPFEGGLSLQFFLDFYNKADNDRAFFFPRPEWFDLLAGTQELRKQIILGMSESEIRATWQAELKEYKAMREKYLLYPDYK